MIGKILVIVPHEDDEINLLGAISESFARNGFFITLVFVTNGDYNPKVTEKRYHESQEVARQMGIDRVIYLGYGDDPAFTGTHTFYATSEKPCTSPAGHRETYGIPSMQDFSFSYRGRHSPYCAAAVKEDIKACILEEQADMILCVDFDEHADHRMTSLLFDEAMCEILRTTDYRPIILKKYAYEGVWFGPEDYYCSPMKETILTDEAYFPYSPKQEIRVHVPKSVYPVFFRHSKLYRLCEIYQSQYVAERFTKIVNADAQYFYRDASNLALKASVVVSSGNASCLNDFKLIDTRIINDTKENIICDYQNYTWIPSEADTVRKAVLHFAESVSVREIRLLLPFQREARPRKLLITLGDACQTTIETGEDTCEIISLEQPIGQVSEIEIQILEGKAGICGIREIEVYPEKVRFPWKEVPFKPYNPKSILRYRPGSSLIPVICAKYNMVKMFVQFDLKGNGVGYYLKRIVSKIRGRLGRK